MGASETLVGVTVEPAFPRCHPFRCFRISRFLNRNRQRSLERRGAERNVDVAEEVSVLYLSNEPPYQQLQVYILLGVLQCRSLT